jgi:hypothetical protein
MTMIISSVVGLARRNYVLETPPSRMATSGIQSSPLPEARASILEGAVLFLSNKSYISGKRFPSRKRGSLSRCLIAEVCMCRISELQAIVHWQKRVSHANDMCSLSKRTTTNAIHGKFQFQLFQIGTTIGVKAEQPLSRD